eukprot:GCRY01002039.1.p1 GENE.GCRY01002039.1~~GCRY01002039.1.p1  ORF type:complete len:212 (+),score=16.73 GCRY01002039.1:111-746(+)
MDRPHFLGVHLPEEIKALLPLISKKAAIFEEKEARKYMQQVVKFMLEDSLDDDILLKVRQNKELQVAFYGFFLILRAAVRAKITKAELKSDLEELKPAIRADLASDLCSLYDKSRNLLSEHFESNLHSYNSTLSLDQLRWRVDVAISTSALTKVLTPSVVFELKMRQSPLFTESVTLEASVEQFQQMRFAVAKILREMQDLEKRQVFQMIQ